MSFPISISKTSQQLPVDPLLVVTRTAIGLGLGILMADKIKPSIRQAAAIALVAIPVILRILIFISHSRGSRAVCDALKVSRRRACHFSQVSAANLSAPLAGILTVIRDGLPNRSVTNRSRPFAMQTYLFRSYQSPFGFLNRALLGERQGRPRRSATE